MKVCPAATLVAIAAATGGCVAYSLVEPGPVVVEALELHPVSAWNLAPAYSTPLARDDAAVWTRDGLLLDRLIIIPAVPDGEPIFKDDEGFAALPVFRANMLPNELAELTESSIAKLFGEGSASVGTANLRPHRYGDQNGILLDVDAALTDGPDYKGLAGAFIAEDRLYVMLYIAAVPYYYDRHLREAEAIIEGARLQRQST